MSYTTSDYHPSLWSLLDLVGQGYLSRSEMDGLILFNYTDKCTFEKYWTSETLKSRGTIYEAATGRIVAKTFDKFFNDSELQYKLPDGPYHVYEKVDGSLGNIFYWQGRWRCATRGNFYSEQAQRAEKMLERYDMSGLARDFSLAVEIIYPFNDGPLINYGDREELVLLAVFRNDPDGAHEEDRSYAEAVSLLTRIPIVHPVLHETPATLQERAAHDPNGAACEGWVVHWPATGKRVKIKLASYLRLAKFKARLGPIAVWEAMKAEQFVAFAQGCPEELYNDLLKIQSTLDFQMGMLANLFWHRWDALNLEISSAASVEQMKDFADKINQEPQWMRKHLFARIRKGLPPDFLGDIYPKGNEYVKLEALFKGY